MDLVAYPGIVLHRRVCIVHVYVCDVRTAGEHEPCL